MGENPQDSVTGIRLEPVRSFLLNASFCYEVLSLLVPDVNAEQFFRIITPDKATDIFIRQTQFVRTCFSSGCFTFNLPARTLISEPLFKLIDAELIPGFIVEIQDPGMVLSMSQAEITLLKDNLQDMTGRGGQVWLDDVTPEMTDFFLTLKLPLAGVKTDRSALPRTADNNHGLISLVEKCRQLAPLVVVEGIETMQMKQTAQEAGAQAGQGYLWPGESFLYPNEIPRA
ncbi:EAL domain-containing protein [Salmonella enterica subsp. enterica serovar Newport]|nr:EAL domain-containing protein [Salmonella enterica subsp. enterica serovar Newport]MJR82397.1 hypothetical protein [Salmonella enterica subsp. enterica serovar Newport]